MAKKRKKIAGKEGYRPVETRVEGYTHKVKPHTRTVWKLKKAKKATVVRRKK